MLFQALSGYFPGTMSLGVQRKQHRCKADTAPNKVSTKRASHTQILWTRRVRDTHTPSPCLPKVLQLPGNTAERAAPKLTFLTSLAIPQISSFVEGGPPKNYYNVSIKISHVSSKMTKCHYNRTIIQIIHSSGKERKCDLIYSMCCSNLSNG